MREKADIIKRAVFGARLIVATKCHQAILSCTRQPGELESKERFNFSLTSVGLFTRNSRFYLCGQYQPQQLKLTRP
jgi:hypothetical protein